MAACAALPRRCRGAKDDDRAAALRVPAAFSAPMEIPTVALLLAAGLAGGIISSMVGGAAIITFPTLLAVGLPPAGAIATNLTALTPGNFIAALDDRGVLPPLDRDFVRVILASVAAATVGAALLMQTPARLFTVLVPLLLGFATVLFAYGERVAAWLHARAIARGGAEPQVGRTHLGFLLPVSFYGGYFGAGVGVLLIAVLSIGTRGDYRAANVAKNLVTSLNSLFAAIVFAVQGATHWGAALIMMVGAVTGGVIGARIARNAPRAVMRVVVVAIGALLTAYYAWHYWI
jgi:uncharacterized membrane protein YfcA